MQKVWAVKGQLRFLDICLQLIVSIYNSFQHETLNFLQNMSPKHFLNSGGSKGARGHASSKLFLDPTFLQRYKILNFDYIAYCKYSRLRKVYKD